MLSVVKEMFNNLHFFDSELALFIRDLLSYF